MTEKQQRLIKLLEEMFQLNQSDLNFGIYRIMNAKADEISTFLRKDLIGSISEAFQAGSNDGIQKELDDKINSFKSDGFTDEQIDNNPKIQELRSKLSSTSDSTALENDIYSHLATFFSRYYKDGDFVSLRRYKKDTYAIPYEGEEVKLHWANSDQYYIKTSEYFRDYTFKASTASGLVEGEEKTIHFKLIDADTEANNNKASADKERRFVIYEESPVEVKEGELTIYFEYKAIGKEKQDKLNEKAIEKIFEAEGIDDWMPLLKINVPTEKNKDRTLLEKHLKCYTSRNSFDYFIHKDLGGFMKRELDFYIKNEMLHIDDIEEASTAKIEESLNKIKTFKAISRKIIAFLTQLEEFQKSLWLKKKFIIETNYCITLDKIDKSYYKEILTCKAQLDEWKTLFDVKVSTLEELKNEPYLVLDTKFFDDKFKNRLLGEFDNLDEEIDGVLINSENFGALNLLQERYKENIDCIYIDPPYNTGEDGFLYADNYKNSSWLSFVENRLSFIKTLWSDSGSFWSSIDDNESHVMKILIDSILGKKNFIATNVWQKRYSRENREAIGDVHEYIFTYAKSGIDYKTIRNKVPLTEEQSKIYKNPNNDSKGRWRSIPLTAQDGHATKDQFYEIKAPGGKVFTPPKGRCWGIAERTFKKYLDDNRIYFGKNNNSQPNLIRYLSEVEGMAPWTWLPYNEVGHTDESKKEIYSIFSRINNFVTPKPTRLLNHILHIATKKDSLILDFFAGSGTTGHSTIKLNREDNGKRKYILVEMGEYFDTVTKPRIQKVIYSDNWKDGKPQDKNGISQIFKYFRLESYEDTLNNLAFKRTEKQSFTLQGNPAVKEDYLLNYMLNYETNESQLNIDNFSRPFDYKLHIATGSTGETKETAVDLVETFNYLIGLKVKSRQFIKAYLVIEGSRGHSNAMSPEKILIIWREGDDNEALNSFFSKMDFSVYDREFDTIYVNGDNNLANLKKDEDHFKVKLIEEEFKLRMFS